MKPGDKQWLKHWEDYRKALIDDTYVDPSISTAQLNRKRIELEEDPVEWIYYFFPNYAKSKFARFHINFILRVIQNPEWYEVLSWSRELAKSTTVMMVVLYLVLTGKKRNTLLISNSWDNAARLLEPYRANLDSNKRIIAYYGEQRSLGSWESGEFKTKQGAAFRALGAGQSPRGTRSDEMRPDTILVDDFDTDEECKNPQIINKKWDWFEQAVYPTRSVSNPLLVIFAGNIIAKDCAITRAGAKADNWDVVNIRDKNGKSTWPDKNSEANIDRTLSKISTKSAQQEYFNNPTTEGEVFKEIVWGSCPPLSALKFVIVYADPSTSNKDKATKTKGVSYKAVFIIGQLQGKFYIYNGWLDQTRNSVFVDWFYSARDYIGSQTQAYYYIENNTLQDPFYEQVFKPLFAEKAKEKGIISIRPDERRKPEKFNRIEGNLEPLNRDARLIFNEAEKDNPHMVRLADQFKLVNPQLSAPADGPDCIEGGVFISNIKTVGQATSAGAWGKRATNKKRI